MVHRSKIDSSADFHILFAKIPDVCDIIIRHNKPFVFSLWRGDDMQQRWESNLSCCWGLVGGQVSHQVSHQVSYQDASTINTTIYNDSRHHYLRGP